MSIRPRYGVTVLIAKLLGAAFLSTAATSAAGAASTATPVRLLVFGDSLVAGYGLPHDQGFEARLAAALEADGRRVVILDGGVSGDTSAGGRARIDWALGDRPQAMLLELGANDGLRGLDPAAMEQNLAAILGAAARAKIPVLLTGMEAPPNFGADYTQKFRAVYARLAERPGVLFDPFFLQDIAGVAALNQDDRIHPNAIGVEREVSRLKPLVEQLLERSSR